MIRRALSLAIFPVLAVAAPLAFAQPAPPSAPPAAPGASMHRGMEGMRSHQGGGHEGAMIVPPGTWWKNPNVIASLSLTADQQKKLDSIFLESRISLVHLHASLEEEQLKLEPLLNTNPPDQGKTLAQISKIADLRADLEKADAKMLLSLRSVLTADQWTKMQTDQRSHRDDRKDDRKDGRGGGRGQGMPSGPQGPGGGTPQGPGAPQGQHGAPPPPME